MSPGGDDHAVELLVLDGLDDQVLALAQQQRAAARENLELIQKSFNLGETDLFVLLRAGTAAFEAEQACSQQEIAQALSRARLNQAQGVLP